MFCLCTCMSVFNTMQLYLHVLTKHNFDNTIKEYLETSSVQEDLNYCQESTDDDELTTQRLKELQLRNFPDFQTSERTIAQARPELGWVHKTVKYCQD